jgi:hypothetical protein
MSCKCDQIWNSIVIRGTVMDTSAAQTKEAGAIPTRSASLMKA